MSASALAVPNSPFSVTNIALPHSSPSPSRSRPILSPVPAAPRSAPPILHAHSPLFHVAEEDDDSDLDTPIDQRPIGADAQPENNDNNDTKLYADPSYSKIIGLGSAPRVRLSSGGSSPFDSAISSDDEEDDAYGVTAESSGGDRIHLSPEQPPAHPVRQRWQFVGHQRCRTGICKLDGGRGFRFRGRGRVWRIRARLATRAEYFV